MKVLPICKLLFGYFECFVYLRVSCNVPYSGGLGFRSAFVFSHLFANDSFREKMLMT